jgi:hypothetical protein
MSQRDKRAGFLRTPKGAPLRSFKVAVGSPGWPRAAQLGVPTLIVVARREAARPTVTPRSRPAWFA